MLELSAKLEYALLALIELTKHYDKGETIGTKEIAKSQNIPDRYLDQILAELKRSGIIKSFRGAKGGHLLSRRSKEITLAQIIKAIAPNKVDNQDNYVSPCRRAVSFFWQEVRQDIEQKLSQVTLEDLFLCSQTYEQSQPMYYI